MTFLDRLQASFAASLRVPEGVAPPVALLWTDADGQWLPLLPQLRAFFPELFTLAHESVHPYDPALRLGPAIWLRCVVDRALPDITVPEGKTPILYLPRVNRQELRAAGECPPRLSPLVELQFRGRVWHQSNGRDWSVQAFLVSEDGLGLEIAQDRRTEEALLRGLELLVEVDIDALRGRRLDAEDFDKLFVSDPVRDLLRWMSTPEVFEASNKGNSWESFCNVCRSQFNIDPDQAGVVAAGIALATGKGSWDHVWHRFCEAPQLYPGIGKLLSETSGGPGGSPGKLGQGLLALDASRNPKANEEEEADLRNQLESVGGMATAAAAARILQLEAQHGARRDWVWAAMGQSPWARVLAPLSKLAQLTKSPAGGTSLETAVSAYAESGWQCDRLAMEALAQFKSEPDRRLLGRAIRAIYLPWLEDSARHFQELFRKQPAEGRKGVGAVQAEKETCLVFVDGLRYDLGVWLTEKLEARSLLARLSHRLAPLPTVTPTAKPAATPVSKEVKGSATGEDFLPMIETKSGLRAAQGQVLSARMAARDVETLDAGEVRFPSGSEGGGWTECGKIDSLGHKVQGELPLHLENEVDRIADRVGELLDSGWKRVRVVTDHGWLLLPDGLPKVELPAYLTATKWARCAVIKGDADPAVVAYAWHWNPEVRVVSPPGVASFFAGETYTHGGVSLQECVVPEIVVERGAETVRATIPTIQWRGMRCRVAVDTTDPSLRVDLRTQWKQASSSIVAAVKQVGQAGEVSLAVTDDDRLGDPAMVVLLDAAGKVLDRRTTSVGEAP
jgi:hypothetical protein